MLTRMLRARVRLGAHAVRLISSIGLIGSVLAQPVTQPAADHAQWESAIQAFEAADAVSPPPKGGVLFIGSSSIRLWTTLAEDFPGRQVINRGFGGSRVADSTHFASHIVVPYAPRLIVMYAGGNDINDGATPEQVAGDFRHFVEKVRRSLPSARIAYISIAGNPARWAQVERVRATNRLIEAYTKSTPNMVFIDVFPRMLGGDGLPNPEIFSEDRLHMNREGYRLWTKIVGPYLDPDR
jgi:lysophospholipase L1-like esterase